MTPTNNEEEKRKVGRPKLEASKFREALIAEIEANAKPLAEALVKKGLAGDVQALKEIADRGLGKSVQGIDLTNNGKDLPTPILAAAIKETPGGFNIAIPTEETQ